MMAQKHKAWPSRAGWRHWHGFSPSSPVVTQHNGTNCMHPPEGSHAETEHGIRTASPTSEQELDGHRTLQCAYSWPTNTIRGQMRSIVHTILWVALASTWSTQSESKVWWVISGPHKTFNCLIVKMTSISKYRKKPEFVEKQQRNQNVWHQKH